MNGRVIDLVREYSDFLTYCIFGAMATGVNMLSYELFYRLLAWPNVPSTILSWLTAVSFAFVTNRLIVFRAKEGEKRRPIIQELGYFYLCRALSGVLDVILMFIAVDLMAWNHTLWKFISNLLMGLCNYLAGKFLIFRQKAR